MGKILITGATGDVGKYLSENLIAKGYDIITSSRNKPEEWGFPFKNIDITDLEVFTEALEGVSTLIHLAGQREPDAGFDALIGPNIRGAYNAFEAAHKAGVKRVIFASSVNASNAIELASPIADEEIAPSSLYGVSKVFGESLGKYYSDIHGLSCIALRMGWTLPSAEAGKYLKDPPMDKTYANKVFLSTEDFTQLVILSIEASEDLKFGIYNALSDNKEKLLDISKAKKQLNYQPEHDSFTILESIFQT